MRQQLPFLLLAAFFLALLFPAPGRAQADQFWTSVGIDRMVASRFNLEIEQQLRLKDKLSTFYKTFTEISLGYRANNRFSASGNFRYINAPEQQRNRASLAGVYEIDLGLFSLIYRLKLQRDFDVRLPPENAVRNRLALGYKIKSGLSSYFQVEISHEDEGQEFVYRKYRITSGFKKKLTAIYSVNLFILYQKVVTTEPPSTVIVFGALYQISL